MLGREKGSGPGAQGWEVAEGTQRARASALGDSEAQGIPLGTRGTVHVQEQKLGDEQYSALCAAKTLGAYPGCTRQRTPLRGNIIGRSLRFDRHVSRLNGRSAHRALSLIDQPAGQVGGRVLGHPLVKEFGDFFPEIRGVCQPGKLIRLKCGSRSRQEKFPRGLGAEPRHGSSVAYGGDQPSSYSKLSLKYTTLRITSLWKTVENFGELQRV